MLSKADVQTVMSVDFVREKAYATKHKSGTTKLITYSYVVCVPVSNKSQAKSSKYNFLPFRAQEEGGDMTCVIYHYSVRVILLLNIVLNNVIRNSTSLVRKL